LQKEIKLLELFSGIGGLAYSLKEAGFNIKKHFYSDIDKNANAVYEYHFKKAVPLGGIKSININKIEKPTIITFGSPCQDFSYEGSKKDLKGEKIIGKRLLAA